MSMKTILVLAANPTTVQLQLDEEVRNIRAALERSKGRDGFRLETRSVVRWKDVRRAIEDLQPEVVHFSGHGAGEEGLLLEDEEGGGVRYVSADALRRMFELFPCVECVVLNACYSEVQARAIYRHVSCVIGMSLSVGDRAARDFAEAFYDGLGAGRGYQEAFDLGLSGIANDVKVWTPVLLRKEILRDGIDLEDLGIPKFSAIELEQPGGRMSIDTLESFVGSLNWVKKHSRSLYGLPPSHQDQLVGAIKQARREPILDFDPVEINVLELASHYVFYCLQDRPSPTFKRMSKKEYLRKLAEFSQNGQQIRVGKEKLSILVRESENRLNVKEDLSKIIEKLEFHNEI